MSDIEKISLIREMIDQAETAIRSAKQALADLTDSDITISSASKPSTRKPAAEPVAGKIIEGTFNGQNMIGDDGRSYPVPANYASKSKLVVGDTLKLTITDAGSFLYKQIGPIERQQIVGTLIYENSQYKVQTTASKKYNVLLASVTYFKAEIGDQLTIIIPKHEESVWAAIENILTAHTGTQDPTLKIPSEEPADQTTPVTDEPASEQYTI